VVGEGQTSTPGSFLIVDGHEDLALNTLADGRDYLTSARAIRAVEAEAGYENPNGICMLGLADWLAARVAVIFATVQTIPRPQANPGELSYASLDGAHQQALAHVDVYRRWAATCPQVELVTTRQELGAVTETWTDAAAADSQRRVGLVLLMENADPVRSPAEVAFWAEQGIRLIGPAWHANRYSGSTKEGGGLSDVGRELLVEMGRCGMTLDLTHMSEDACLESLATYEGAIVATHAHSRRTNDIPRLLSDQVVEGIVARDGIVGVLPLNWALDPTWHANDGKEAVKLDDVVHAIDAVCEIAGDAQHVAIGSDFDGGQGAESSPAEIDTIADLPKLAAALGVHGFAEDDIAGIMGRNWLGLLGRHLP
jgi:membrane dipeptidase